MKELKTKAIFIPNSQLPESVNDKTSTSSHDDELIETEYQDQKSYRLSDADRSMDVMMRAHLDGSSPEVFYTAKGDVRAIVIGKQRG